MKRIILLTCVGTMLAWPAWGAPNKPGAKSAKKSADAPAMTTRGAGHAMRPAAPGRTARTHSVAPRNTARISNNNPRIHARNSVAVNRQRAINHSNTVRNNRMAVDRNTRNSVAVNHQRAINHSNTVRNNRMAVDRNTQATKKSQVNPTINRAADVSRAIVAPNRERSAPIVNNWRSDRFSGQNYAAFRDYRRQWHDRSWWRNHHSRLILVSGGWWYWNSGYWYPAWGYDPSYSYYPYDGPIYGYSDLTPDQVIVNVQTQLRADGYYVGSVDGVLGPQTRRAIAAFQADHGLAVTSAVDEPTLATLGLT